MKVLDAILIEGIRKAGADNGPEPYRDVGFVRLGGVVLGEDMENCAGHS